MDNQSTLLASCLESRRAFTVINGHLAPSASETVRLLLRAVEGYYQRDEVAQRVDRATLAAIIKAGAVHEKTSAAVIEMMNRLPTGLEVSADNVAHGIQQAMVREARHKLAAALEAGVEDLEPYQVALRTAQVPFITQEKTQISLDDLRRVSGDRTRVHPKPLNDVLAGGLAPGHTVIVFGRPGAGKSMVCVNLGVSFLRQGKVVLHVINEESAEQIAMRYLSLICMAARVLQAHITLDNLAHANQALREATQAKAVEFATNHGGYDRLHIVHGIYNYNAVRDLVERLKPDLVIVDQVRHMGRGGDMALHEALESVTQDMRQHAHEARFVAVGVTQAGQTGEGKEVLDLGDIDGAKTGLQGACDVIIGLGVSARLRAAESRCISICRNKVSGKIQSFPIRVDEQHTLLINPPEDKDGDATDPSKAAQ